MYKIWPKASHILFDPGLKKHLVTTVLEHFPFWFLRVWSVERAYKRGPYVFGIAGFPGSISMAVVLCGQFVSSGLILSVRRYRIRRGASVLGRRRTVLVRASASWVSRSGWTLVSVRIVGRIPLRQCILVSRVHTLSAFRVDLWLSVPLASRSRAQRRREILRGLG